MLYIKACKICGKRISSTCPQTSLCAAKSCHKEEFRQKIKDYIKNRERVLLREKSCPRKKKYRETHREYFRIKAKEWYKKNKERRLALCAKWRKANPCRVRVYTKRHYWLHRSKNTEYKWPKRDRRIYHAIQYQIHKDEYKAYRKENYLMHKLKDSISKYTVTSLKVKT